MKLKRIRSFALMLALLSASAAFISCGKKQDGLNDTQSAQLINVAEAFYECGLEFSSDDVINTNQLEMFVYYLYNDELTAGENGFGRVSFDEADAMVESIFGMGPAIHKNYSTDGSSPLYSIGQNYYVKVEPSNFVSSEIEDVTLDDDGHYRAAVNFTDSEGMTTQLRMVFDVNKNDIRVLECIQYVNK
ncbi:MAG: hypothetical protein J1E60_02600 [Christensenellaceae bacterium]|nr:hypothetical protein [Christensenellaceae bacterium]